MMSREIYPAPLSKTAKYKKITKPLLERKRRARINRCLDELKDLMVGALEIDDDNMSKLEKADILELTVNHLTKLHSPRDPVLEAKKFQAGFGQCAAEACRFILSVPDLDARISENLVNHLSRLISTQPLTVQVPGRQAYSPPVSPPSPIHEDRDSLDFSDNERYSSDADDQLSGDDCQDVKVVQPVFSPTDGSDRLEKVQHSTQMMAGTPSVKDLACPMTGLLTTVDKIRKPPVQIPNVHSIQNYQHARRNTDIGNTTIRPTPDSKDIILQKIRQHIMEKRSHDSIEKQCSPGEVHNDKKYPIEVIDSQKDIKESNRSSVIIKSNTELENVPESLDLRKVRSPSKILAASMQNVNKSLNASKPSSVSESSAFKSLKRDLDSQKIPQIAESVKDLSVDYHNLPPKKKRKHLEYQEKKLNEVNDSQATKFDILDLSEEQKSRLMQHYEFLARQELARDNLDMACQECDEEGPMWRPW